MKCNKKGLKENGLIKIWLSDKLGKSYAVVYSYVLNRKKRCLEVLYEMPSILKIAPKYPIISTIK